VTIDDIVPITVPPQLRRVLEVLRGLNLTHTSEDEMQRGISMALTAAGIEHHREVVLGKAGRIDFVIEGRVGIECKVAGPMVAVYDQVHGYAQTNFFDAFVVATTKPAHARMPRAIPVEAAWRRVSVDVVVFDGGLR